MLSYNRMPEKLQTEHSFYPINGCFDKLTPAEQELANDFMSSKRILGRYLFDFDKNQTVGFIGKMYDRYGQVVIDSRFVLDGYHHFLPRQLITGNDLRLNLESFKIYQD